MVQYSPLEGSTGKRRFLSRAALLIAPRSAPGPEVIERFATSTSPIEFILLKSTMTPGPIAPPPMLVPDPRGTSEIDLSPAHFTRVTTSSASSGTATAAGTILPIPAASEYTALARASDRYAPRNPAGAMWQELTLDAERADPRRIL
jgi:hypothetical protein